jgi:hypothetical protein
MAVYLAIMRIGHCEICNEQFNLWPQKNPDKCPACGSVDWEWGPECRESIFIRQGIQRARRRLNPGATSKKRQDHGRKQWRQFKPKPEEEKQDG